MHRFAAAALLFASIASPAIAADDEQPSGIIAEAERMLENPDQPFVMLVKFDVKPGSVEAFLAAMDEPRIETVKEPGNLAYELSQSATDPNGFILYEHWKSVDALDSHLKQPYLVKLLAAFEEVLAKGADVEFFVPSP